MSLPTAVAIKLDLYTLACRELLKRLDDLNDATQFETRLDYAAWLQLFDEVLRRFLLRASQRNIRQASDQFNAMLRADVEVFRPLNERAAAVFDAVVAGIANNAASWHYQHDLERFHTQGRELAQRFFAASFWPETQARSRTICRLVLEYGATEDGRIGPTDDRVAPAAYRARRWDADRSEIQQQVVLLRFDLRHTFASYLSFPFLFLHEYTAHVYATDHENEIFNDGWMLYAADAFLTRLWNADAETVGLDREQVKIFQNYWYPAKINPIPLRGCNIARDLDSWLSAVAPERFLALTYELAAFQPAAGEATIWPTQFVYALEHAFRTDRQRLRHLVQTTSTARDLLRMLQLK